MVKLTRRGDAVLREVTARRRAEIAGMGEKKMPARQGHGLVAALTAFTAASGEPAVYLDAD